MATRKAAEDLRKKLIFERDLREKLSFYDARLVRMLARQYASNGNVLQVAQFDDELAGILSTHYKAVSDEFTDNLSIRKTDEENQTINDAMAIFLAALAVRQTQIINETTQQNANLAIAEAQEDELVLGQTGTESNRTIAVVGAAIFARKLAGRRDGIAITETQFVSEASKATEAEVLSGLPPSVSGGSQQSRLVTKEWVTVGDNRVRDDHLEADGQTVPVNEPFRVGGELLRWPSDTGLGASLDNVINCRCDAVYNEDDIRNRRG